MSDLGLVGNARSQFPHASAAALEAFTVYQHLNSEGGLVFLLKRGDYVDLGYATYHPGPGGRVPLARRGAGDRHEHHDANCAAQPGNRTRCSCPHAKPRDVAQYRAFFKVVPRFDAEFCALRFPARDLARLVAGADPEACYRSEQSARSAGAPDFLQQVYRGLRRLMLDNRHSGDDLAQTLAIHRRTLNRRLKAEDTTFQRVLDEVRFDVARQLLSNTNVHLDDIAATLGYAAVTPFMRTFRRWSGMTPGQWRRTVRAIKRTRGGLEPGPEWRPDAPLAQGSRRCEVVVLNCKDAPSGCGHHRRPGKERPSALSNMIE